MYLVCTIKHFYQTNLAAFVVSPHFSVAMKRWITAKTQWSPATITKTGQDLRSRQSRKNKSQVYVF
jgi:hypothetical protein